MRPENLPAMAAAAVADHFRKLLYKRPSTGSLLVELDGLRGFAVLFVIASHTKAFGLAGHGAVGVWIFYTLSGFLLSKIFLAKLPSSLGSLELTKYSIRRIARILPLYYLTLFYAMWEWKQDRPWLLQHLVFYQADGHFWSIPQEELFYLILPLLVAITHAFGRLRGRLLPAVLATAIAGLVIWWFPLFKIHGNGKLLPFYVNIFILGFAGAHLWFLGKSRQDQEATRNLAAWNVAGVSIVALLVLTAKAYLAGLQPFFAKLPVGNLAWQHPTLYGLACALLLGVTLKRGTWPNRFFSVATPAGAGCAELQLVSLSPVRPAGAEAQSRPGRQHVVLELFGGFDYALAGEWSPAGKALYEPRQAAERLSGREIR